MSKNYHLHNLIHLRIWYYVESIYMLTDDTQTIGTQETNSETNESKQESRRAVYIQGGQKTADVCACFLTSMFHKVVWQHMQDVVGFLIISLLSESGWAIKVPLSFADNNSLISRVILRSHRPMWRVKTISSRRVGRCESGISIYY